jgi:hypothetical protein
MEYNQEKQEFEISMRIFKDDLQMVINHNYDTAINLIDITGQMNDPTIVNKYINDSFYLKSSSQTYKLELTDHEITEEAVLLSYTSNLPYNLSSLEIRNSILMDFYHDQTNLVIFSYTGKEKGLRFTINEYIKTVSLEW